MSPDPATSDAEFVRSALAASDDCIKILSLDGRLVYMTEGGMRVMDVTDFSKIYDCPWPDFWTGEGNVEAKAAVSAAASGKSYRFVGVANTMAGRTRWWDVQVSPILGADGTPERILSVSRDITDFKLAEQRNQLLAREMTHRVKNTLSLVQSIVGQTLRPGLSLDDARSAVLARLAALGKAHDMLSQSEWSGASVGDILRGALPVHGSADRFKLNGPAVELPPERAMALALAIHELAVNSAKYGSLSTEEGHVEVTWSSGPDTEFAFRWSEVGGPGVSAPTRTGFGSALLQRAVPMYFDGDVTLTYEPTGVVFQMTGRSRPAVDAN